MKKAVGILLLAATLLLPLVAQAAVTLVQQTTASGTTGGPAPALSNTAAGNTLVLLYAGQAGDNTSSPISTVVDTQGNTWTKQSAEDNMGDATHGAVSAEIWTAANIVGGAAANTVTITTVGTTQGTHAYLNEWSGLTGTKDKSGVNGSSTGATTVTSSDKTEGNTTNANDVIFGVVAAKGSPTRSTGPTGTGTYTAFTQPASITVPLPLAAYQIVSATQDEQITWTISASSFFAGAALSLKQTAVAAAPVRSDGWTTFRP